MPSKTNFLVLVGAIVAICAQMAAVVIALCLSDGPQDRSPVATTVLTGFAATVAALVAILKSYTNGQAQKSAQNELRANTEITAAVAEKVGVPCSLTRSQDGSKPV